MKPLRNLAVLIPDGESNHSLPVVQQLAAEAGISLHVLSSDPDAVVAYSRYLDSFDVVDADLVRAVAAACDEYAIDVIMPVSEDGIMWATRHRESLERSARLVRLPPPESMQIALDKSVFAREICRAGLPTPTTIVLDQSAGFSDLEWPVLAKPVHGHAGEGIRRLEHESDLHDLLETGELPVDGSYILQSFVQGTDVDCSVLAIDGSLAAFTIQQGLAGGKRAYSAPDAIEFVRSPEIAKVVAGLVDALQWNGVGHVDLVIDETNAQPFIIELNPRFWASLHGSFKAGVNFPLLLISEATGRGLEHVSYDEGTYMSFDAWVRKLGVVRHRGRIRWIGPERTSMSLVLRDPRPHVRTFARRFRRHGKGAD